MKILLSLFCLVVSLAASAAEPVVQVLSPDEVRVDGANAGQLADVMRNHPQLVTQLQVATVAAFTANQTRLQAEKQAALDAAAADKAAALAAKDAQLAICATYIAQLQAKVRELGGVPPAPPSS